MIHESAQVIRRSVKAAGCEEVDTVIDADMDPATGTGLTFAPNAAGLSDALQRSRV